MPADDRHRNGGALRCTGPVSDGRWYEASDNRKRRHQDGTQPDLTRFENGVTKRHTLVAEFIGVIDLKNSVLLDDAQQQQHTQRAPQIQRSPRQPKCQQCKRDRHRQAHHDGQRMQQAFELRGKHHVHEDACQKESDDQAFIGVIEGFYST